MRAIPSRGESPVGERGKAPFDDSSEDFLLGVCPRARDARARADIRACAF